MTITYNWRSSATLGGATELNRVHLVFAREDVGLKLERTLSALSVLQSAVSMLHALGSSVCAINIALGSAAMSMAGVSLFSAFSAFNGQLSVTGVSAFANVTPWSSVSNFST